MNIDTYSKIISETFTDLKINKISLLGKGKAAIIFLVNDEIVFKIPLQKEGEIARWQKNEAVVLKFLEGKLDIEIPKILFASTSECGFYIIGETLLSGTTLSYELCDTYDDETKNDILMQLGEIVRKLHNAGGHDSSWLGFPETFEDIIEEFDSRFSNELRSVFSNEEIKKIEKIAERYKTISIRHPVKPVLCHNDLHFFNLMFDTKNKKISGILDFGCASYSEPARDLHYYFDAKYIHKGYGDNGDRYFLDRQKFHALSQLLCNLSEEIASKQKSSETLGFIKKYILIEDTAYTS